jgi:hypothetical protein
MSRRSVPIPPRWFHHNFYSVGLFAQRIFGASPHTGVSPLTFRGWRGIISYAHFLFVRETRRS